MMAPAMRGVFQWPSGLRSDTICFTVGVEWASTWEILADLRRLFDQHGVRATFFVTHSGVERPGHEREYIPPSGGTAIATNTCVWSTVARPR
jgi:hypothetical protein